MVYKTVSSLDKCFPDLTTDGFEELRSFSMLSNERYSFQICYDSDKGTTSASNPTRINIVSPLADCIRLYKVRCVPSEHPVMGDNYDDYFERTAPGLFPDVLEPVHNGGLIYRSPCLHAIWVEVEPSGRFAPGVYQIGFSFSSAEGSVDISVDCEIIGADLPDVDFTFTQWFHTDCLMDYYSTGFYDERLWTIVEKFAENAARYGQNMILTPVLSPSLDTAVGIYRTNVQLADITLKDGKYTFGFSKLRRWIEVCERCGIKYFEINHLFTQWGAAFCPQVYADVDGEQKRIFGWDVKADSEEYLAFLGQFLPALLSFLKNDMNGKDRQCFFHISDEPAEAVMEHYGKLADVVKPLLCGRPLMDALSDYAFYEKGYVDVPIPSNDHADPFIEKGVKDLWVYYCCGQGKEVSNRFFSMPSARNRIIGFQFWKFGIKGFLQWGYNFYNSFLSQTRINPFLTTDGDGFVPSGDTCSVYPGPDGTPWPSAREVVFFDALQDMRALALLEKLEGRNAVLAILEEGGEPLTLKKYPRGKEYIHTVRERVNAEIKKLIPA